MAVDLAKKETITTKHSQYETYSGQWEKLRDAAAGQTAVHAKGTKYLPKLSGQSDDEYGAYRKRALFYGATGRTIEGLSGMIFRKEPTIEAADGTTEFLDDVTLDGTSILGFAEAVTDNVLTINRAGILVDYPSQVDEGVTVAQAEAQNIRPFLKEYKGEAIYNWRVESVDNVQTLTQCRLWEYVREQNPEDEFEFITIKQIRVLDLFNGQYRQRIYRKNSKTDRWEQWGEDVFPKKNNQPLNEIPFFFCDGMNSTANVEKPPLIDLADTNLSHYLTTADVEHGARFTALPTAVITGFKQDVGSSQEFKIGSTTAWVFPSADTKAEYLEFQGQGLEALEKRLVKKEGYMAALGARMLEEQKRGVEAAETTKIYRMGENSSLAGVAGSISDCLTKAVNFALDWAGLPSDFKIELNKDFMPVGMTAQELQAQMQLWQSGGIAYSDFLRNLKRGEVVAVERTEEEIRDEAEVASPFVKEDFENDQ